MSRSRVLAIALLCGAAALLVVWCTRSGRRPIAAGERAELVRAPVEGSIELRAPAEPALVAEGGARDELGSARRAPLDDRAPISGRVVVAGGFPAGEEVKVRAEVYLGRVNTGNTQNLAAPVASDGSFEIFVPRSARYALLDLESRMLDVRDPVRALPGATDVVLAPEVYAVIEGTVLAPLALSGASWDGVAVSVGPSSEAAEQIISTHEAAEIPVLASQTVHPNADSAFELAFVPVGRALELRVRHPSCLDWSQRLEPLAAAEVRRVSIVLDPGITISGRVLDEHGLPVEGVRVGRSEKAGVIGRASFDIGEPTDSSGSFEFARLPRGNYELIASSAEIARGATLLVDGTAGDARDLEFSVVRGQSIEGTVRWRNGRPAESFYVTARGATGFSSAQGGKEGHFRLCGLLEDRYEISAQATGEGVMGKASAQEVQAGESALELVLEESASYTLRGTVVNEKGAPVTDFSVSATSSGGGTRTSSSTDWSGGDFVMRELSAGATTVRVEAPGLSSAEQHVVVGPDSPGALRFVLGAGGYVRGHVLDARGRPLAGAQVENQKGSYLRWKSRDTTEADGSFTFAASAGSATLVATAKGQAPSEPVTLDVASGATVEGVVLRLRDACRLNGTALDADGKPLPDVSISVNAPGALALKTDMSGAFAMEDLPAGSFQVTAYRPDQSGARATATAELAAGQLCTIELRFAKQDPVLVHGRITKNGRPLACHLNLVSKSFTRMTSTASDGALEIELQAPGEWHGAIWLSDGMPDPDAGDVRRFEVSIPDADEHSFELDFDTLSRLSWFDDIWR